MIKFPTMTNNGNTWTIYYPDGRIEVHTTLAAASEALRVAMRDALDGRNRQIRTKAAALNTATPPAELDALTERAMVIVADTLRRAA